MCGIAGFVHSDYLNHNENNEKLLYKMTDLLSHRGPDNKGYYIEKNPKCKVALGHRRLSIIDLNSTSNQPMIFKNLVMIFNGEYIIILNFVKFFNLKDMDLNLMVIQKF